MANNKQVLNAAIEMLHARVMALEGQVQTLRVETEKRMADLHDTARSHADLIDEIRRPSPREVRIKSL